MLNFLKRLFNNSAYYVSDAEKFLYEFDKTHPEKSDSQLKELSKHEHVAHLRDHAKKDDNKTKLWEGF